MCVLLKGSTTVVAPPDGVDPVLVNTTGTPWLATAGTGDVLAGLAGALLAQGLLPPQAAIAAAYLHGLAARLAAGGGAEGGGTPRAAARPAATAPVGRSVRVTALRGRVPRGSRPGAPSMMSMDSHAEASVELGAITRNIAAMRAHVAPAAVMAVVKANGYGHGAVPAARAALRGGADWLGVVHVAEALELRRAGLDVPLLCLMAIGASTTTPPPSRPTWTCRPGSADMVRRLAAAADGRRTPGPGPPEGRHRAEPGRRHPRRLAVGCSRRPAQARATRAASTSSASGRTSPPPTSRATRRSRPSWPRSRRPWRSRRARASPPQVRHIANTAAALDVPEARYDLVRVGGGSYGLATLPGGAARLAAAGDDAAGAAGAGEAGARRNRGVVRPPVHDGAGDDARPGAARLRRRDSARRDRPAAGVRPRPRWPIAGTVCMDQFVVDFGDEPVAEGDEVVLFGPGDDGEPTAQEWGEALGTISYEIVTGIGARVRRSYRD